MKAGSLLIVLHVCLSYAVVQLVTAKRLHLFGTNDAYHNHDAVANQSEDAVNVYSNSADNNYSKNNSSAVKESLPRQGNPLESHPISRYWVNENNQINKEAYWSPPRPIWDQQISPYLPNPYNPSPNNYYPDNNNNNWYSPDPNQNECYNLVEVIRDLRVLLEGSTISAEKQNIQTLFRIIKKFILNNNLQYVSFSVVVREIEALLLHDNRNHDSLREDDAAEVLEQFKNQDLYNFLIEIRGETNLQVVTYRFTALLSQLKQILVQRGYSDDSIQIVLSRAVQWSVPLIGYYFERECKVKTQQYIVQNLESSLNINLESVQHVASINDLQTDTNYATFGNLWGLLNIGGLDDQGYSGDLVGVQGNQGYPGGLLAVQGNQGYPGGLVALQGNQGYPGDLTAVQGNQGYSSGLVAGQGNQGYPGGLLAGQGNQVYPGGLVALQGNQGYPGDLTAVQGNQGYLSGLVAGQGNQGYPGGLLAGQGNQGYPGGVVAGQRNQGYPNSLVGGQGNQGYPGDLVGVQGNQGYPSDVVAEQGSQVIPVLLE